jgi:hypothetical protein
VGDFCCGGYRSLAGALLPLSTFSIDVDTASYANLRRYLESGQRPPKDAVRIEEMLNYFKYDYAAPTGVEPFSIATEVGPAPWNPKHQLMRVSLATAMIDNAQVPPRNLVFLIDTSGSMQMAEQAAAAQAVADEPADRVAPRAGPDLDRRVCGRGGPRAAAHQRHNKGAIRRRAESRSRPAAPPTADSGHPARLRHAQRPLHQGRHQPRHPVHRRRLQRRGHQRRAT